MGIKFDKPVFIIARGPSLYKLEDHIYDLKEYDFDWVGFNLAFEAQKNILDKINKRYDALFYIGWSDKDVRELKSNIFEYVNSKNDGLLFVNDGTYKCLNLGKNIRKYHKIRIFKVPVDCGSLCNILLYLIKKGVKKFCLFGTDFGFIKNSDEAHYHQEDYTEMDIFNGLYDLMNDCYKMNNHFWEWAGLTKHDIEIVNCSPESHLTCFEKIDYPQLKERINEWKK